ncbi:hypothetical protein NUSPORA_01512 [Nucleospora cyclopteri]
MKEHIGKSVMAKTPKSIVKGVLQGFDEENGILFIGLQKKVIQLSAENVINLEVQGEAQSNCEQIISPLQEKEMYSLFYDAFNFTGPFEDAFIHQAAVSLIKFTKNMKSIKIIVGSDDVFGRIGLHFARIMWEKTNSKIYKETAVSIEIVCCLETIKSKCYLSLIQEDLFNEDNGQNHDLVIFGTNRNLQFSKIQFNDQSTYVFIDIPAKITCKKFFGVGLGFIPEHFKSCFPFFYIFDMFFPSELIQKYHLVTDFANSIIKKSV